jgi:hypothetical protein
MKEVEILEPFYATEGAYLCTSVGYAFCVTSYVPNGDITYKYTFQFHNVNTYMKQDHVYAFDFNEYTVNVFQRFGKHYSCHQCQGLRKEAGNEK